MTKEINATAPTPQDWIDLVRENETLRQQLESNMTEQRKTVHDAVKHFDGVWPDDGIEVLVWDETGRNFHEWLSDWDSRHITDCYQVCTREEFEAVVAEVGEQEWTHIDAFGDPCKILIENTDRLGYVVILRSSGQYATPALSSLKPIKPPITKAQTGKVLDFAESIGQLQVAEQWIDLNHTITD